MKITRIILLCFFTYVNSIFGTSYVDSIINNCKKKSIHDTDCIKCIDLKSYELSNSKPKVGIQLAKKALEISIEKNWTKGIALANNELAICYFRLGDFDSATICYEIALNNFLKLGNNKAISSVFTNLSQVYKSRGNYVKALETLDKALKVQVNTNMQLAQGITLENIGVIHLELGDFAKSKKYILKARRIYFLQKDSQSLIRNTINLGILYDKFHQYDSAIQYLNNALLFNQSRSNYSSIQTVYANLGLAYFHKNDFTNALLFLNKAIEFSQKTQSKSSLAIDYGNIGEVYLEQYKLSGNNEDLSKAIMFLNKGFQLCQSLGFTPPKIEFGDKLVEALELQGKDYKLSFTIFKSIQHLKDSMYSKENFIKMNKLETENEIIKKENELKLTNIENRLNKAENRKQKQHITILILVLIIISLSLILFYIFYNNKNILFRKRMKEISQFQSHQIRAPVVNILLLTEQIKNNYKNETEMAILLEMLYKSTEELEKRIHDIVEKTHSKLK